MKFTIPIPPRTKKNSSSIIWNKKTNKPMIIPSEQYRVYEKAASGYLPKLKAPIDYPVAIKCIFYMQTRRKVDLTNLLEAIDDVLVKNKVIEDDNFNIIVSHDGSRVLYDKLRPRTEVEIDEMINPCEFCIHNNECNEDEMDLGADNAYGCFNRGRL